ncbi:MAG: DUF3108 domain-containing protein [Planctomycetes bacterium]|nr:DUF3108 domain-containing protein [Planctomycetota bacterium]
MSASSNGLIACALFALASAFDGSAKSERAAAGPLIVDRGPTRSALHFPRDEELVYDVSIDLGVLGAPSVGSVVLNARVLPFARGVAGEGEPQLEQAIVSARARGEYQVYTLDETITTRYRPVGFPRILHESIQRGTENRHRELSIGTRDGQALSSYRSDGHCRGCKDEAHYVAPLFFWNERQHCSGCKSAEHRVWRDAKEKTLPAGTLDMVSAVILARTVVAQGEDRAAFTLLDRDKLWEVEITRGKRETRTVSAGRFELVEVVLSTRPPEGEKEREEDFQGLFGLHGNISIWMHQDSGVPVEIAGTLPAGILELDVRIQLERFSGTPPSFSALEK